MVAKILRSTSFLITRLALTSSFSESSLTVMPSEMVISRSMGGGAAGSSRRDGIRSRPSSSSIAMAVARDGLRGMTALLLRRWNGGGLDAEGRRGMHWTRASTGAAVHRQAPVRAFRVRASGLAGQDESVHDKSVGRERATMAATAFRDEAPARRASDEAAMLLQTRHHVGTRRHHGPRGGLTGKSRAHLLAQRHVGRRGLAGRFRWRPLGRRSLKRARSLRRHARLLRSRRGFRSHRSWNNRRPRRARHYRRGSSYGSPRSGGRGSGRRGRQGLPRSG